MPHCAREYELGVKVRVRVRVRFRVKDRARFSVIVNVRVSVSIRFTVRITICVLEKIVYIAGHSATDKNSTDDDDTNLHARVCVSECACARLAD